MKNFKKEKGFTLIELLAVIVILAVIALIATPIIIGIIEDSRESAFKSSLYGIFDATEYKLLQDKNTQFPSDGIEVAGLSMNNNKFISGIVFQNEQGMYLKNITDGKYCGNGYKDRLIVNAGNCETAAKWFEFEKNTGKIINYVGTEKNIIIPKKIDGVKVTGIGFNAFKNKKLTSVTIPDTVTKIWAWAFENNELTDVTISEGLVIIDNWAFDNNKLANIKIPNTVTSIGNAAFAGNQLTDLIIPKNVTSIGFGAFSENKLVNISIPNSVVTMGIGAFTNNHLPDDKAFIYNRNSDGTEDRTSLNSYGGRKRDNVNIPEGVVTIGGRALSNSGIQNITLPNSVTIIDYMAFASNLLSNITVPQGITEIPDYAFHGNPLISINLPTNLITIGNDAFGNTQLTSIIIPGSVMNIGNNAFAGYQLTSVKIIGKSSSNDFTTYGTNIWGWAPGYNDSNITWNAVE